MTRRVWAGLVIVLFVAFILTLTTGSVNVPAGELFAILSGREAPDPAWRVIVLDFRLPEAVTAALAGAALALGGLQMQALFGNPLAGPYVLGVSSGASLGVAAAVLTLGTSGGAVLAGAGFAGDLGIAMAAGIGAALVMGLVLFIARRVRGMITLLVLGLMAGYAAQGAVSVLLYASLADEVQTYTNWTMGSFGAVTWNRMIIFAPAVIVGLLAGFLNPKSLNALLLGETYARSMGIDVRFARLRIVLSTAVLAGAVTAFCGPVSFLGVAVPHLCRALFHTDDHRVLMPSCALVGAITALAAGFLAGAPGSPIMLPLNAVTALIGAPVVMGVILRRHLFRP